QGDRQGSQPTSPNRKAKNILMLSSIKQRLDREDEGFTLIELMVVVLIIAILLAIAIPTFLGARNTANARAAQSDLRNALTAEQTYWTNNQAFSNNLTSIEPSLTWVTSGTTVGTGNQVIATPSDNGQIVVITAMGKDQNCWSIAQVNDPSTSSPAPDGTYYTKTAPASGACSNPAAPTGAATSGSATNGTDGTWYTSF
ncbi:MAG TPA: prepilin-type N-terminal cleavage/methylation domain-containing protein, partial [Acidimicrobiales bacterium]|nr:prepilin-type N-terminal cleavage/methylation domain-containing protein [Acidimicrobiales bacterium]